jgi:membrane dipeptidase
MNFPVFDLHCDTALALLDREGNVVNNLAKNNLHIDLHRAGELPGYAQCFACFTTTLFNQSPQLVFERELETIVTQIEMNRGKIRQAYSTNDILNNQQAGVMSAILTIEGPAGFGFDPEMLEQLQRIGFRITTLGWNEQNPLTGSHVTGGGLTDLGREYVKQAQALNMLIDVSHISDEGFWDIINISQKPIIASHSNSRTVCDVSRNLTDDMFRAICQSDGVAGINLYTDFLGPNADLETVCRHILHFLELDPSGKHIALGGDLDGCETLPKGFSGVQDYAKLADQLLTHGLGNALVQDIFWNNAVGVMKRCCI